MSNANAIVLLTALVGCAKFENAPPEIAPDVPSASSSSGSGGSAASTAASVASSAGAGGMGDSHAVSGSRLKVSSYDGVDGSRFTRAEAFDSVLGFHCRFVRAADGSTRCFPLSWAAFLFFADSVCASMVLSVPECDADSRRSATLYEYLPEHSCYSRAGRALILGDALEEEAQVYQRTADGCVLSQTSSNGLFRAHEIEYADLAAVDGAVEDP